MWLIINYDNVQCLPADACVIVVFWDSFAALRFTLQEQTTIESARTEIHCHWNVLMTKFCI